MKNFTRIFSVLLAVMMVLSCLCVSAFADEEATEAATEAPKITLAKDNIIDVWNPEIVGTMFKNGGNQTKSSLCEEGLKLEYTGDDTASPDPYYSFAISTYYKKTTNTMPAPEDCCYMVVKMKQEGCDGMFEMFAKAEQGDSETVTYSEIDMGDDGWTYLIFCMEFTSLVEARKLSTVRMDWSCGGTQVGAYMIINSIGFFADEDAAYASTGFEMETEAPKTEAPKTEAPTEAPTEASTEASTLEPIPEDTDAPKSSSCGSVVISGAAVVLMAAAAFVALKKH